MHILRDPSFVKLALNKIANRKSQQLIICKIKITITQTTVIGHAEKLFQSTFLLSLLKVKVKKIIKD